MRNPGLELNGSDSVCLNEKTMTDGGVQAHSCFRNRKKTKKAHTASGFKELQISGGNNCDLEKLFAPFGFVESSVIRYRPPLGDREHRSWALVAFENAGMLEKLLESNAYTTMQVACRQSECLFRILQHPGDPSMQSLMLFEMSCIIDMIHYRDQQ